MAVILGAAISTASIALIAIGILTVYILRRRRASAATSSDVLRALPVPVLQPLQRSGQPSASEKLARLFDLKRRGRVQPYAPAQTSTTSAQPKYREFKDRLGSRSGSNAEDTDEEPTEGPNARRQSAAPTLDDAQAGVALVEAARSAGFRVQTLLASLRRVQPGPNEEHEDVHSSTVPPPTYEDTPTDEPVSLTLAHAE
ncbi:hypothetical protein EXIGLDRAFT_731750 [Exidia glandulosa HHB12029]|uniref:Uncharacterized protein n=1 Tax=Exidia glandulosa HHB12029 TaxID=1314781 RepID=A0A165BRI8_EXIGL|nr:hypothetical protein EXIGLDRAFT_731750 [Exidia glandulosa HHB12029]